VRRQRIARSFCEDTFPKHRSIKGCFALHTHTNVQTVAMLDIVGVVEKGIFPELAYCQDTYQATTRADMR
jgi:hypothetical protein